MSVTYEDGAQATMLYNALGQMESSTDPDGVTTLMAYDVQGDQITTALDLPNDSGQLNGTIDYGTDQVSYSDTVLVADGATLAWQTINKIWYTSTVDGQVKEVVANTTTRSADGLTVISQAFGVDQPSVTETELLGGGDWTITATSPDLTLQIQSYTAGLLTSSVFNMINGVADPQIASVSYTFDGLNRQTGVADSRTAAQGSTTTTYISDTADQVYQVTDAGGRTTTFAYDVRGRRTTVTLPDNSITTTAYDSDGTVLETSGSQTYRTTHIYDYADRQIRMITYGAEQAITSWTYSSDRGFMTAKTYDDRRSTTYTYTSAGRLLTRAWARLEQDGSHLVTLYQYDKAGRQIGVAYDGSTPDIFTVYDALGRKVSESNGRAVYGFEYSDANLALSKETIAYDLDNDSQADDFSRVIERTQDSKLRNTGWVLNNGTSTPDNEVIYAYDAEDGRLSSVSDGSHTFSYVYTEKSANLLASISGPQIKAEMKYEPTRDVLLSRNNHTGDPMAPMSKFVYSTNSIGQRDQLTPTGSAFDNNTPLNWTYNVRGELITATRAGAPTFDRTYDYDGIGNRKSATDSTGTTNYFNNGGAQSLAGGDAVNQYGKISYSGNNDILPTYDFDGNMTTGPVAGTNGFVENVSTPENATLDWDAENRLIGAVVGTETATYVYDSQSRLIYREQGASKVCYVYDGWNRIAEYSGTGSGQSLIRTYTWGMDLSGTMQGAGGVGGLLAIEEGPDTVYPTYDGNGNVSEYVDQAGAEVAHFEYDPFGNLTEDDQGNAASFAYGFTKPQDSVTGLYYYGFRYYDAANGRWLNRDPIEEQGGVNLLWVCRE